MKDPHDETQRCDSDSGSDACVTNRTRDLTIDSVSREELLCNEAVPEQIGRYCIERLLGHGGYGAVYLAKDEELQRYVTVKVPHPHRIKSRHKVDAFLTEARTLAKLEHTNIVPVHDVGHTSDGVCYIVSRFIDGNDLRDRMTAASMSITDAAEMVATLAEALHYIHTHGVIHRDIKPSNILLDQRGVPYLADFGLALLENDAAKSGAIIGTPSYMSPEQARGENHLVRGTADIFSLGIILYELISGTQVFRGDNAHEVLTQVRELDIPPLRDLNRSVPTELERVCMKSISKRASDRHQNALDLADDLRHFLDQNLGLHAAGKKVDSEDDPLDNQSRSGNRNLGIVPRGLRSFGNEDAHFFLSLLPGPYDREGTPESILFWKRRAEALDPEDSFRVGLIYGPSGCGKSSFIKAGLIPTLAPHVTPVFVEAAPDATENRLLNRLRRQCPYLAADLGLRETVASLRHGQVMGQGKKVLIVIDQFEQWLYSVDHPEHSDLANALRQCDGEHVQCILLVRDDFWLAFSRFMDHLEVELRHSKNMMLVDLFDASHARRVLTGFGRSFGQLPLSSSEMSRDQRAFVSQAVDDLSDHGKVMPVRLALLAEMVKSKPWTISTLRKIGGTEGVGVMFLDENFVSQNAPVGYRTHQKAAYAMLGELLPQPGAHLKGHMKSSDELLEASGYADQPKLFQSLVRTLDNDLHLITRTDPDGHSDESSASYSGISLSQNSYYQLAHDYLVPSIRKWQTRMQRATRKGRAEIRLAERSEIWSVRPDARHLPTITEWASILTLTPRDRWDDTQRRMMKAATRRYITTLSAVSLLLIAVGISLFKYFEWSRAKSLTDQLRTANVAQVPGLLNLMKGYEPWTVGRLTDIQSTHPPDSRQFLSSSLALLRAGQGRADDLKSSLYTSDPATLTVLRDELRQYRGELMEGLWDQLNDSSAVNETDSSGRPFNRRFNAALVLASYDPPTRSGDSVASESPNNRWNEHADFIADQLIDFANIDRQYYPAMLSLVRPATSVLVDRLSDVMVDPNEKDTRRESAQGLLVDLLRENPISLTDHFLRAGVDQIEPSLQLIDANQAALRPLLDRVVRQSLDRTDPDWRWTAKRKAMAAALLLRHGASSDIIWSVFQSDGIPDARTMLVQRVAPLGVDPRLIAARLQIEQDDSIVCGLIQALGEYPATVLEGDLKDRTITLIKGWFANASQASLRSNALWLLRRWNEGEWVQARLWEPVARDASRDWYTDQQGHTLVRLPRRLPEDRYRVEACISEVTVRQFKTFAPDFQRAEENSPTPDCSVTMPTYHQAVAYCNWLTRQMKLGESQVCYPDREDDKADAVVLHPDYRERTGYRLATSEEWFYIQSGGSFTRFPFADDKDLVDGFATFLDLGARTWPMGTSKPNDFGVFDMLTGVREWVSDVEPGNPLRRGLCGVSFRYKHFRGYETVDARRIGWGLPDLAYTFQGFRVVRSAPIAD